ncbi:sugar ABC transporter permease [Micromonospora sp. NPDC023966]|uniref:carbohydrate ABC transporter permease n=1 Tax=Micromonospora sp. NPDC023966 TaxID=3154699 RepID=UPI0033E71E19
MTSTDQTRFPAGGVSAPPAGHRPAGRSSSRRAETRRKWYEIIGLTTPALVVYVMFVLVPMGFAVYYSLYRWRGVGPPTEYIGFKNYTLAFQDPIFLDALRNNAIIVFGSLLIQGPVALGIALLLNRRFRGRAVFRLLAFVPYVLAEVTVGIMWKLILAEGGTVDALLRSLGLGSLVQAWLADLDVVIWTLLFVLTWKYVGFAIILLLAGLSNVPHELTEAAAIDGASWWQTQRHVTLPLLGPTIRIWMFLSMIGSLQVFDVIWVTSVPAIRSLGASGTMATYMVDNGFFARLWGYGNAVAVILFVISFVAALLFQRFILRRDIEGAITRRAN